MQILPKVVIDLISRNGEVVRKAIVDLRDQAPTGKDAHTTVRTTEGEVTIREVKPTG